MDLVSKMREGRRSPAVLKTALSHLRSVRPDSAIFVFEGAEDVGVYEVWISRCKICPEYEALPGKGKDQLLGLRKMLREDTTGLRRAVYFFLDRDFDGLKGQTSGADVYVHDTYSVENCLACDEVVESLLNDEFRCAGNPGEREKVLGHLAVVRSQFHALVREINFRLFLARKCSIRLINLEDSIFRFATIEVDGVEMVADASVEAFVHLEREPSQNERQRFGAEFDALDPQRDYRGKYEFQFVVRWVTKLAEDRRASTPRLFSQSGRTSHVPEALTLRSFAGRCPLPTGLDDFLAAAA